MRYMVCVELSSVISRQMNITDEDGKATNEMSVFATDNFNDATWEMYVQKQETQLSFENRHKWALLPERVFLYDEEKDVIVCEFFPQARHKKYYSQQSICA